MTLYEYIRMICYVAAAPTLLGIALWLIHRRLRVVACGVCALSMLALWYMVEIALASTGINTREYRVIGTPMIVVGTISAIVTAIQIRSGKFW